MKKDDFIKEVIFVFRIKEMKDNHSVLSESNDMFYYPKTVDMCLLNEPAITILKVTNSVIDTKLKSFLFLVFMSTLKCQLLSYPD